MILDFRNTLVVKARLISNNANNPERAHRANLYKRYEDMVNTGTVTRTQPKKKSLRHEVNGSFAFIVGNITAATVIIRRAVQLGLTVSGDNSALRPNSDINQVKEGSIVTFGTSKSFDIDWIKRPGYSDERNIRPIYEVTSFHGEETMKVLQAIKEMANEKATLLKKAKKVTAPTYRHLKLDTVDREQNKKEAAKRINSTPSYNILESKRVVADSWVRIGGMLIPKNPQDIVIFN